MTTRTHTRLSVRARHAYQTRRPIIGADFLAIEDEARAQLERALSTPHTMGGAPRRADGTARSVFVRVKETAA